MYERQTEETYEQKIQRLNQLSGRYLSAWAQAHTSMEDLGFLPFDPLQNPFQAIDHYKTLSLANRYELDLDAYTNSLDYNLRKSFADEANMAPFVNAIAEIYPYSGGNGRSYIEYVAEEYLSRGLSVAAVLGHPEDKLTDSPRFISAGDLILARFYGLDYAGDMGLVAGVPLKLETYKGTPINDVLAIACDVYYSPTKSQNSKRYQAEAGLSDEEMDEMTAFMGLGAIRAILNDTKPKVDANGQPTGHGKLITVNATGTRAEIKTSDSGEITHIGMPGAEANTARLMANFGAFWPVVVMGDYIKLGPVIDIKPPDKSLGKEARHEYLFQQVEDTLDIVASLIDDLLGKKGVARYARTTRPGAIYQSYFRADGNTRLDDDALGRQAIAASKDLG